MVSFLLYVSPFGAGMPNPGERLGFNLVCKKCSPQNYKGGGSGWVQSRVGGSKVGWVGLVQNTPPPSYKRSLVLMSVMRGPILFYVGRSYDEEEILLPHLGIRQGDPLSRLLFDVLTIFLIYDFKRLRVEAKVLLHADDILICVQWAGKRHETDVHVLMYLLNLFGHYSGLKINMDKTLAVVSGRGGHAPPPPREGGGVKVKPFFKDLGVLVGNLKPEEAWGPTVGKLMARAEKMSTLSLGLQQKAHWFASWVTPVAYLTAQAYEPPPTMCGQMNVVQRVVLGLKSWHLTRKILLIPERDGGMAHASLSVYATWVHSQTIVAVVS